MIKVQKRKKRINGKLKDSKYYYLRYRFDWMVIEKWRSLGVTDKQVAEKLARDFVTEQEQERMGIIQPKSLRNSAKVPLKNHLTDYLADLKSRGRDGRHGRGAKQLQTRIKNLFRDCAWNLISDIGPESFIWWRNRQSLSPKTLNHYLNAISGLLNWMEKLGRIQRNPLRHVDNVETRGKERRLRRALTDEELGRLVEKSGPRGTIYLAAARSGLRQEELKQLTWDDVELDQNRGMITVRDTVSKNRKQQRIPLLPELREALLQYRPISWKPHDRVFTRGVPRCGRLQEDLATIGVPYQDDLGRYADFHALRMTFSTYLQRNGVPIHVAKIMMRHSDIRLTTQTYLDEQMLPLQESISGLPGLRDTKQGSHIGSQISVSSGHLEANIVSQRELLNRVNDPTKSGESRELAGGVSGSQMVGDEGLEPPTN